MTFIIVVKTMVLVFFFPLVFTGTRVPLLCTCNSFVTLLVTTLLNCFIGCQRVMLSTSRGRCGVALDIRKIGIVGIVLRLVSVHFLTGKCV